MEFARLVTYCNTDRLEHLQLIEIQRRPSRPSWRRRHGEGKIERITSALSDCVSNV